MVLNQAKCHFMCLGRITENKSLVLKNKIMQTSEEQKILRIIINIYAKLQKSC